MVLNSQKSTAHNAMLGRKIQHPPSTKFYDDDGRVPSKRLKTFESTDDEDSRDISGDEGLIQPETTRREIPGSNEESDVDGDEDEARPTELENALPPVKTDKDAIVEYEAMRAAEQEPPDLKTRLGDRKWTRGQSSIYVDAFNLALETVLEDEGHLFDEKEMEVFRQWESLQYEAQYL